MKRRDAENRLNYEPLSDLARPNRRSLRPEWWGGNTGEGGEEEEVMMGELPNISHAPFVPPVADLKGKKKTTPARDVDDDDDDDDNDWRRPRSRHRDDEL